jgi:hypothetical protein
MQVRPELVAALRPSSPAASESGDYGASDYPFQGSEGDRPFVDEAQQASRMKPWLFVAGGFAVALVVARFAFGK